MCIKQCNEQRSNNGIRRRFHQQRILSATRRIILSIMFTLYVRKFDFMHHSTAATVVNILFGHGVDNGLSFLWGRKQHAARSNNIIIRVTACTLSELRYLLRRNTQICWMTTEQHLENSNNGNGKQKTFLCRCYAGRLRLCIFPCRRSPSLTMPLPLSILGVYSLNHLMFFFAECKINLKKKHGKFTKCKFSKNQKYTLNFLRIGRRLEACKSLVRRSPKMLETVPTTNPGGEDVRIQITVMYRDIYASGYICIVRNFKNSVFDRGIYMLFYKVKLEFYV